MADKVTAGPAGGGCDPRWGREPGETRKTWDEMLAAQAARWRGQDAAWLERDPYEPSRPGGPDADAGVGLAGAVTGAGPRGGAAGRPEPPWGREPAEVRRLCDRVLERQIAAWRRRDAEQAKRRPGRGDGSGG